MVSVDSTVDLSHLHFNTAGCVIDGELILPKGYTFQETCKAIKKQRDTTPLLEYHIFDIVHSASFSTRMAILEGLQSIFPSRVKLVPTCPVKDYDSASVLLSSFLEDGFEGLMLRNALTGGYCCGQRSEHLQKFKTFVDDEFDIIDVVDGTGKEEGAAVFVCVTQEGKQFRVRPMGTYEDRREQFENRREFIGRKLTVVYQNLTDDGLPRFPVGKSVRESWDA
jgi:DNA ligase-1